MNASWDDDDDDEEANDEEGDEEEPPHHLGACRWMTWRQITSTTVGADEKLLTTPCTLLPPLGLL